jgi:aminocarboxymuconate-semialdehyde decarboxylase
VGVDGVALGSDYPFDMGVADGVARIREAGFDDADTARLLAGNAAALFGL